jgi:hypothetical protein
MKQKQELAWGRINYLPGNVIYKHTKTLPNDICCTLSTGRKHLEHCLQQ